MGKKKKYRGHYCWCCGRIRANEKFSGRGHARHLCRDCAKLGNDEIAYRQHQRDIERLLTFDGRIRKKCRARFEEFFGHENARVRRYAEEIKVRHDTMIKEEREWRPAEESAIDVEALESNAAPSEWSAYILLCSDGSYYVGSTSDLRARVQRHQDGRGAHYTRNRRPVRLVYMEACPDEKAARARERQIKGWTRAKKQALIDGDLAGLKSLALRRSKNCGDGR